MKKGNIVFIYKVNMEISNIKKKIRCTISFFRFYSEALFFKVSIERINEYEKIFNDILGSKEKYKLIVS